MVDFRELLGRVPAIIYVADTGEAGCWRYVSPHIQTILGFTPEEWRADPTLWARRLHPEDRERVLSLEASSEEGSPGATEYRLRHRDGHLVWIRDEALLVCDRDGSMRWHGVLSDVTDRKQAEAELERRAAQQSAVARLGEHALEGATIAELMQEAVGGAAEILEVECAAVLEFLMRSGLSVPTEGPLGPFGILGVQAMRPREYAAGDIDFLQSLSNVLADALERQATEDRIRHRALHDPLTGLPNRALFLDRLEQALARLGRRRSRAAVLFLDFDRFKLVNDSLGHQVGDELLAAAAPRLKQAVRASDTVARFGGDEFGILLEDISGEQDAIEMAQRIASVFARPFVLAESEHIVTTSIGIALAQGGELADELIRDADAAMYRAKERGRARYEIFDEAMRERAIGRLRAENDLRRALERSELRLEYQPVVSLRDNSIISFEALLRWDHPERGQIPPSEFIPIAEEGGMIEPIGRWVLEQACRQAAQWHETHPRPACIGVSVNLSAVQVANPGFPGVVAHAVRAAGLQPSSLSLEITESVMLRDAAALTDALPALKAVGVRLVLDDFGTGYSSLRYLTRLPLDALKIDRSFVDGLGTERRDTVITEAIIAISQALSLEVIAEGVETSLQAAELSRLGCGMAQGFLFSPPVRADAIADMIELGALPGAVIGRQRSQA